MQLNYSENMAIARAGMKAISQVSEHIISRACDLSTGIGAGRFVAGGTDPTKQAKLPVAATDITGANALGFAVFDAAAPPGVNAGAFEFDQYDEFAIMRKGTIWVFCLEDVDANDPVYVRYAGTGEKGSCGDTAVTDETALLPSARFITASSTVTFGDGSTQKIACVEINLP